MKYLDKIKARWLAAPAWQRYGACFVAGFVACWLAPL
jgi:hypothetical protein